MRRLNVIFFLVLASLFCFKEIASVRLVNNDYSFCLEDVTEDGQNSEEGDTDSECDLLFSGTFQHEFQLLPSGKKGFNAYSIHYFKSPYSEIQLPPPELI